MKVVWVAAVLCIICIGCDDGDGGEGSGADASAGDAMATAPDAEADPWPEDGCGETAESLRGCVDMTRYAEDLEFVARPRGPGSPHLQAVQDRCAEVFAEAGFTVERHAYGTGVNVVGYLPGVSRPDEHVYVSAHYDHVHNCAGADDNASGTAGVLEAARVLGKRSYARTLVVACWDEEEIGHVGSGAYVERLAGLGQAVHANYVFEMIGTREDAPGTQLFPEGFEFLFPEAWANLEQSAFRGDFIAIITDDLKPAAVTAFEQHAAAVGLPTVTVVLNAAFRDDPSLRAFRRSDHAEFWARDMNGVQLTDTANFRTARYHCSRGEDDIAEVDVAFALKTVQATVGAAAEQAGLEAGVPGEAIIPETPPPPQPACDLRGQDCPDGQRCVHADTEGDFITRCVAAAPEGAAAGEECVRPDGVAGIDTCAPGLFCALWGLPKETPQRRRCFPYCESAADCGEGLTCAGFGDPLGAACAPTCDLRDPVASCPEGSTCRPRSTRTVREETPVCTYIGEATAGQRCTFSEDCAPGLSCEEPAGLIGRRCVPMCFDQGDCGDGETCYPARKPGLPEDFGYCFPTAE